MKKYNIEFTQEEIEKITKLLEEYKKEKSKDIEEDRIDFKAGLAQYGYLNYIIKDLNK